ncbi:hypothetical protein AAFC00_000386 [Neodothiora populina]|uniref:Uncharacterized protein n=1 Tax=Neodothiora populina TaxID=2781224 RepID=A0ABR3PCP8_9PEZI
MEESMPVDAEVKREAETIRQVRERDSDDIGASSPGFIPGASEGLEGIQEDASMGLDGQPSTHSRMGSMSGGNSGAPNMNFNLHASRNSAGLNYWNKFDKDLRTPPPPPSFSTRASSSLNGDINMDSPAGGGAGTDSNTARSASVVSMSDEQSMPFQQQQQQQSNTQQSNNNTDFARKFGKRRREDDFDLASAIKRRAVSPSLSSVNGSPVVNTASPARSELNNGGASNAFSRENTAPLPATLGLGGASSAASAIWGQPPKMNAMSSITRESSMGNGSALEPVRSNSGGSNTSGISMISSVFGGGGAANASTTNGSGNGASSSGNGGNPPKRIGLQGMVDTNDGIMNMSIE